MNKSDFKPDMSFWSTFKIVFVGLIQWPFHMDDWTNIWTAFKDLMYYGVIGPLTRLVLLLLLPISAVVFTFIVQAERRAEEKQRQRMRAQMGWPAERIRPIGTSGHLHEVL